MGSEAQTDHREGEHQGSLRPMVMGGALTLLPVIICILTLSKGAVAVLLMAPG